MEAGSSQPDAQELAALYVSGALPDEEAAAFERRLATDAECLAALQALEPAAAALADARTAGPPAGVRAALLERIRGKRTAGQSSPPDPQIWKRWIDESTASELVIQRASEGDWEPTGIDGVEIRRLFVDRPRNQLTMLVRMAAGTSYPRHIHAGPEECYVLQGELRVGQEVLHAGDYQRAAPGSFHGVQSTERGCLLFIVSSMTDELV
jgi:quercetin dioxygenase-like cupin family protein